MDTSILLRSTHSSLFVENVKVLPMRLELGQSSLAADEYYIRHHCAHPPYNTYMLFRSVNGQFEAQGCRGTLPSHLVEDSWFLLGDTNSTRIPERTFRSCLFAMSRCLLSHLNRTGHFSLAKCTLTLQCACDPVDFLAARWTQSPIIPYVHETDLYIPFYQEHTSLIDLTLPDEPVFNASCQDSPEVMPYLLDHEYGPFISPLVLVKPEKEKEVQDGSVINLDILHEDEDPPHEESSPPSPMFEFSLVINSSQHMDVTESSPSIERTESSDSDPSLPVIEHRPYLPNVRVAVLSRLRSAPPSHQFHLSSLSCLSFSDGRLQFHLKSD